MKSLFIAFSIGVVITLVLLVVVGLAGGACHCDTPMKLFFPFGTMVEMRTEWEDAGTLLMLGQFPVYVVSVSLVKRDGWRIATILLLLALHAAGVAAADAVLK